MSQGRSFVYYCSGHGYGHATRVSAFAGHLLSLEPQPTVVIVSSAPKHVFSDSIAKGASYRYANIDPVVVQPLAYRVDRGKSIDVLKSFLFKKDAKLAEEIEFLQEIHADCVLSDAAFLGCLAAHACGIPSVLITNFSFDSVYSYLSTPHVDQGAHDPPPDDLHMLSPQAADISPDDPIPAEEIEPLVAQIHAGYRCADLLLRLPGEIPMPSFAAQPALPSPDWIDPSTFTFTSEASAQLAIPPSATVLLPELPFSCAKPNASRRRSMRQAPLLVRSPNADAYTPDGRSKLLRSIGVPEHLHDPALTKILIVSFGGQSFRRPHSRTSSRNASSVDLSDIHIHNHTHTHHHHSAPSPPLSPPAHSAPSSGASTPGLWMPALTSASNSSSGSAAARPPPLVRLASESHLFIPGAPPAAKPPTSPTLPSIPTFVSVIPPSPHPMPTLEEDGAFSVQQDRLEGADEEASEGEEPQLLPDVSWIAIVCGVAKEWGREHGEELPEGFYVAPKEVYMPDLTAVADVLLGKLGYGTVSECVDACTPFVYVPRPLFIEEHGLRRLLDQEGVGVMLSRSDYEAGAWAGAVADAWARGREAKERKRERGEEGLRKREGMAMARELVMWLDDWQEKYGLDDK